MDMNSLYENMSAGPMAPVCRIVIPKSCCLVIFGASGDLAQRKLIPAIYRLFGSACSRADFSSSALRVPRWIRSAFASVMAEGLRETFPEECDEVLLARLRLPAPLPDDRLP